MSAVVSKNLFALLGNDHEEDSDREEAPVKVIDKATARTGKRNAPAEAPASKRTTAPTEPRGGRRGGYAGNEGAMRDRNAGSANNRSKPTEEGHHERRQGHEGRGRGRGGPRNFDRHSRGVGGDSEKQANHGWGANEGGAELADEKAGEAMAKAEQKDAVINDGQGGENANESATEPEPEDNSISYADYLAQQAEKKLALGSGVPAPRKPNEGSKPDKKWANAKEISKDDDEDFIAGAGTKAKRERERKQKQVVEINHGFQETHSSERGRGGFRGGRGRGEHRGGRGGDFRGGRGGHRGGRGGDHRGDHQQHHGGSRGGASFNMGDKQAFPSLGA